MSDTVPGQLYTSNMFCRCWLKILVHNKLKHPICIATTEPLVRVHGPCLFYHVRHKSICLPLLLIWEIRTSRKEDKLDLVILLYCWMNYSYMNLAQTCHTQLQSGACLSKKCEYNMSKCCWASVSEAVWAKKRDLYVTHQYWNYIFKLWWDKLGMPKMLIFICMYSEMTVCYHLPRHSWCRLLGE